MSIQTSYIHPAYYLHVSDSAAKDAAQKIASDLDGIYQLLESLQKDPSEANEPAFLSQLAGFVRSAINDYNGTYQSGVISHSDLISMYQNFNNLLQTTKDPSSQVTFEYAIEETLSGKTTDLTAFLQELTKDPGALKNFMDLTSKSAKAFQKYADTH